MGFKSHLPFCPVSCTYSPVQKTHKFICPGILQSVHAVSLCHNCISRVEDIMAGNVVVIVESSVIAGIQNHHSGTGLITLKIWDNYIHRCSVQAVLLLLLCIKIIIQPRCRNIIILHKPGFCSLLVFCRTHLASEIIPGKINPPLWVRYKRRTVQVLCILGSVVV